MSGGGLKWSGVGRAGGGEKTAVTTLQNRTKEARQRQAMSAPKVGSAPIVCPEDFHPFENAAAIVREGKRLAATQRSSDFHIEHDDKEDDDGAPEAAEASPPPSKKAKTAALLSRDQKREIELSVIELQDELEEAGTDPDDVDDKCDALRRKLTERALAGAAP